MIRSYATLSIALLLGSCQNNPQNEQTSHHSSETRKPVVALVPVFDSAKSDVSWNLSDELTASIQNLIQRKDKLFLMDRKKVRVSTSHLKENNNPFSSDLSWVKKTFSQNEFVVFLELIEHEEVPYVSNVPSDKCSSMLNMSMRVRVLDLRPEKPKIVLQELIHASHHIPLSFTKENFNQAPYPEDSFSVTPIGLAHEQLTKEIVERVQDYILLSTRR